MTGSATAMTPSAVSPNAVLADRAVRLGRQHPPRTAGRRAAAAVYVALTTTKTTQAARKALATFGDPVTRAAAATLLEELTQEDT
jgi:hypothetical protein